VSTARPFRHGEKRGVHSEQGNYSDVGVWWEYQHLGYQLVSIANSGSYCTGVCSFDGLLPPPRRLCNRRCLSVCLLSSLCKNFQTYLHKIFKEEWQWANEQMIKFWWWSGSGIWICIATLVRRPSAEVCTVAVFLVGIDCGERQNCSINPKKYATGVFVWEWRGLCPQQVASLRSEKIVVKICQSTSSM